MRCEEFEARLNAVLDERQRPEWDAELRLHSRTCGDCRQLAAAYQILLDGFYELAAPDVPADMALRVADELRIHASRRRRISLGATVLATAAGLLLAAMPFLRDTSSQARPGAPTAVADARKPSAARPARPAKLAQFPIVPELLSRSEGDAYAELARETGQNLATVMLYVPGIGGTKGIIDADIALGDDESTWTGQMSEGLKPVSESVAETLNLLLDSLPVGQLASRS